MKDLISYTLCTRDIRMALVDHPTIKEPGRLCFHLWKFHRDRYDRGTLVNERYSLGAYGIRHNVEAMTITCVKNSFLKTLDCFFVSMRIMMSIIIP